VKSAAPQASQPQEDARHQNMFGGASTAIPSQILAIATSPYVSARGHHVWRAALTLIGDCLYPHGSGVFGHHAIRQIFTLEMSFIHPIFALGG
jgi:hypothetical protein